MIEFIISAYIIDHNIPNPGMEGVSTNLSVIRIRSDNPLKEKVFTILSLIRVASVNSRVAELSAASETI